MAHEIHWHEWDKDAFAEAQAEDKPILLSISAVWCHWCHVMDETSYSDPEVISLINELFIPIRVDNDQRPDINARYNMGGWPTTAFLTPNGDVISGATYMPPQQFMWALGQVSEEYHTQRDALLKRARELQPRPEQRPAPAPVGSQVEASMVETVSGLVRDAYDPEYGGFGSEPKFPMVSALEFVLHMYQTTGDASYREMVEQTLDGMMNGGIHDHEEGGFFRYSTTRDWSVPHFEKMLEGNVGLLRLYLLGHLVTGKDEYAAVASGIVHYLHSHLYDRASGVLYGSQDADEEYYSVPLARRREKKPPEVDPVIYTALNSMVASCYLEAAWVLDRTELKDMALKILEYLMARCEDKPLRHSYSPIGEPGIPALLTDYAYLVLALVDAHGRTTQGHYLEKAQRLAAEMTSIFWDQQRGGFFDIPEDPQAHGNLRVRHKPIGDNVPAIEALTRLFNSTLEESYRNAAETSLSFFAPLYQDYGEAAASYGLAVQRFLYPPVEVKVLGEPGSPGAGALLRAAATIPYPHTMINFIDTRDSDLLSASGCWPADEAQAYVCMDTVCLAPISDPRTLHQVVADFLKSPTQGMQSII